MLAAVGKDYKVEGANFIVPLLGLEKTSRPSKTRGELRLPGSSLDLSVCVSNYIAR